MIRFFSLNDIEQIYNLGTYFGENFKKTNDLQEIYYSQYTKILVYEIDNKLLGFLMYTKLIDNIDILYIVVKKDYQQRKIASCLLDYMISDVEDTVKLITLEVRKSNFKALNLYKKFGFEIVNIRKNYYNGEDAYLMGRKIR